MPVSNWRRRSRSVPLNTPRDDLEHPPRSRHMSSCVTSPNPKQSTSRSSIRTLTIFAASSALSSFAFPALPTGESPVFHQPNFIFSVCEIITPTDAVLASVMDMAESDEMTPSASTKAGFRLNPDQGGPKTPRTPLGLLRPCPPNQGKFSLRFRIRRGVNAAVITQLTDVETELNGFQTYDRAVLKMPSERIRQMNTQVIRGGEQTIK